MGPEHHLDEHHSFWVQVANSQAEPYVVEMAELHSWVADHAELEGCLGSSGS